MTKKFLIDFVNNYFDKIGNKSLIEKWGIDHPIRITLRDVKKTSPNNELITFVDSDPIELEHTIEDEIGNPVNFEDAVFDEYYKCLGHLGIDAYRTYFKFNKLPIGSSYKPYMDESINKLEKIRVFERNIDDGELKWHRDREHRIVEVIEGNNWKYQSDNVVPIKLSPGSKIIIPEGTYHRVIKGDDNLKIKITIAEGLIGSILDKLKNLDDTLVGKILEILKQFLGDEESLKKIDDKVTKLSDESGGTGESTKTEDGDYIVLKDNNYTGKNVHVFFAGKHSYDGGPKINKMQGYIPILQPFTSKAIILITHWHNTVDGVRKYADEKFGAKVTSIAGFSKGGETTWRYSNDSSFSLVGFIDPSIPKTNLPFGTNTYMFAAPPNWGRGVLRDNLQWYCDHQSQYNGHVKCFFPSSDTHMNLKIVKDFYAEHGDKI